jgi:hypothetical protein
VVVVEGTACFAWHFADIRRGATGCTAVVSDEQTAIPQPETVAPILKATLDSHAEQTDGHLADIVMREPFANDASESPAMTEDELLVAKIYEAVAAGHLTRNLASIRKFLECGQPKAARLYRLYRDRFGEPKCRILTRGG